MNRVYLSLGSNLGNREENLKKAIHLISQNEDIKINRISSIYETEPIGFKEQDWFLNMVIEIETGLEPHVLLNYILNVERNMGRVREIKWGPRIIDIDILLYDDIEIKDRDLQIPHPRMLDRAFVLIPLVEINPDIKIAGVLAGDILKNIKNQKVNFYKNLLNSNNF